MKYPFTMTACALAACVALGDDARAQDAAAAASAKDKETTLDAVVVTGKRERRVSKGATNLPLEIKDTPQSISTIEREAITDYGLSGSNDALRLGTGINVEQYETNRAVYQARGFEVQLTQIDGLGMTNDWGTVVGQQDSFIFERIELIRGANGLLTGVGNSSGTINYVRKRPTNKDGGVVQLSGGSYHTGRVALDYNKVFTADGSWAGRLVVAHEDKDSYLRALHDTRSTLYGVVDGQIGDNGMLTLGFTYQDSKQKSPMWGSLTLNRVDGSQADFDVSSSTSQDWARWDTRSQSVFAEYTHTLSADWEAKLTYTHRRGDEDTKLLYAYVPTGALNMDNTGLVGWAYRSTTEQTNDVLDANLSGQFKAFGRTHHLIAGLSHSRQETERDVFPLAAPIQPLPAFPYAGNVYAEPGWGPRTPDTTGEQQLTRLYAAMRFALTDSLKAIGGLNAIRLEREGASLYGSVATANNYPKTEELSPYLGVTYDITPDLLGYVSYSDIFQNQDQTDINGAYLAPMKGVNVEAGVKAEWLDRKFLTTFALFSSKQKGLATYGGITAGGTYWYEPKDVKSQGFEIEATGRITQDANLTLGFTKLDLTGPDGKDIYEWVPRQTFNLRFDSRVPGLPGVRAGINARWQSDVHKIGGARQKGYTVANAFAAWEMTDAATLRFNVNNLTNKKYVGTVEYGAIYGAPRNFMVSLDYKL
ncbi:TonB-dependent siderophore receptor [Piscinibacter sp.]|uniref:TonB-dependent siderophore receptor n=1 Tax=Piscinibacter sp. TaxID=1903157 RepID=UPI0039E6602B